MTLDLSLWRPGPSDDCWIGQGCHSCNYWLVYKNAAGNWWWQDIVTDEWDVVNECEIEMIEAEDGPFDTWELAATDCQSQSGCL